MTMGPTDWPTISQLLSEVLELEHDSRDLWVENLEPHLQQHSATLRRLLAAHRAADAAQFLRDMPSLTLQGWDGAEPSALGAGSTFGAYTIDGEAGRGGMSVVYRAHRSDGVMRRKVALKMLRPSTHIHASLARFAREREILAGLTHANIARLYDTGIGPDGQPYLAMELVEGLPVDLWCDQHSLCVRDRITFFLQILDAVQFAHEQLVVHRDIKPSNIFITRNGEVKLLDFGIAKLLSDETGAGPESTEFGTLPLTISYASPEQIRGAPLGIASDVYSLGVLLFRLLTGAAPYAPARPSRASLEEAILTAEPLRPSQIPFNSAAARSRGTTERRLAKQLTGDLDTIVLKALRKPATDRYPTAQAFKDDLQRHLQGQPVLARPDSLRYRAGKFLQRNLAPSVAAAVVLLLVAAFIFGLTSALQRTRAERDRADRLAAFMTQIFTAPDPSTGHPEAISARGLLDNAAEEIESDHGLDADQRTALTLAMARSYTNLGAFVQADQLLRRQLARAQDTTGAQSDDSLSVEAELVWELNSAREHTAAVKLGQDLLARERRIFGPEDRRTVLTETYLYTSLASTGNFAASAELAEHAAQALSKTLGADSIDVLDCQADAAYARFRAGQAPAFDAEMLLRKLISRAEASWGPAHFRTLRATNRLSVVLARESRFADEVTLLRGAVARAAAVHRNDAVALLDLQDNLAAALIHVKSVDEAETILRHSIEVRLRTGDRDNPRIGMEEYNIACVLAQRGRVDEAIQALQSAVDHRLLPDAALHMQSDGDLSPLVGDPRFTALVRHVQELYAIPPSVSGEHGKGAT